MWIYDDYDVQTLAPDLLWRLLFLIFSNPVPDNSEGIELVQTSLMIPCHGAKWLCLK
jgi:hypothetical protein